MFCIKKKKISVGINLNDFPYKNLMKFLLSLEIFCSIFDKLSYIVCSLSILFFDITFSLFSGIGLVFLKILSQITIVINPLYPESKYHICIRYTSLDNPVQIKSNIQNLNDQKLCRYSDSKFDYAKSRVNNTSLVFFLLIELVK